MITEDVLTSALIAITRCSACVQTGSSWALTGKHARMSTSARLMTPAVTSCVLTPRAPITAAARRVTGGQRLREAARTSTSARRTTANAPMGVSTLRAGWSALVPWVWSSEGE